MKKHTNHLSHHEYSRDDGEQPCSTEAHIWPLPLGIQLMFLRTLALVRSLLWSCSSTQGIAAQATGDRDVPNVPAADAASGGVAGAAGAACCCDTTCKEHA